MTTPDSDSNRFNDLGNQIGVLSETVKDQGNQIASLQNLITGQVERTIGLEREMAALIRTVTAMEARLLSLENRTSMFHILTVCTIIAGVISIVVAVLLD